MSRHVGNGGPADVDHPDRPPSGPAHPGRTMSAGVPVLTAGFWRTRRSAAIAGIVFGVLLLVALVLVRVAWSDGSYASLQSDRDRLGPIRLSLQLVPFAGIAFLWFIGVYPRPARRREGPALLDGVPRQRRALPRPAVQRRCHRVQHAVDARGPERRRRRVGVRPEHLPGAHLRLRHADGGRVHPVGQHGGPPHGGASTMGLVHRVPGRAGAGGRLCRPEVESSCSSRPGCCW